MADLFPYITEEVQKAINTIAITMREHNFNGSIAIAPEIYAITEADGQLHYYRTNPPSINTQQQQSQIRIFDIVTEINFNGTDIYPLPPVYQYDKTVPWKDQVQQVLQDIIKDKQLEAVQLQKYYHLGQLYNNKPASYHRQMKALKYEWEITCKTRTIGFHLKIASGTRRIFEKKGLNRLYCNIELSLQALDA